MFMGFVPGFDSDLFISYASRDNRSVDGEGWIRLLKDRVYLLLSQSLGEDPEIWVDLDKVGGNDDVPELIKRSASEAAALACVLTPSYLSCKWCLHELHTFHK